MDDLLDLNFSSSSTLKPLPANSYPKPFTSSYPSAFSSSSVSAQSSRTASPAIPSNFDFLASIPSNAGARQGAASGLALGSGSGLLAPLPLRSTTPGNGQARAGVSAPSTSSKPSGADAFADLLFSNTSSGPSSSKSSPYPSSSPSFPSTNNISAFSASFNQNTVTNKNLTLAERQAQIIAEKKDREEKDRARFDFDAWGSVGGVGAAGGTGAGMSSNSMGINMMGPSSVSKGKTSGVGIASPSESGTDINGARPKTTSGGSTADGNGNGNANNDLFDLLSDHPIPSLSTNAHKSALPAKPPKPSRLVSQSILPGTSDSMNGNGFNGNVSPNRGRTSGAMEEDDILGLLGQPTIASGAPEFSDPRQVNRSGQGHAGSSARAERDGGAPFRPRSPIRDRASATAPTRTTDPRSRHPSPPPHVLGRIVEMGFSPAQARKALGRTETGLGVEAALELLLGGDSGGSNEVTSGDSRNGQNGSQSEPAFDPEDEARERRRRRRQGPPRDTVASGSERPEDRTRTREPTKDDGILGGSNGIPSSALDVADQADKLMSQASEIGLSMFNKANSLWSVGKEKARVMYEDRAAAAREEANRQGGSGPASASGSRQGGKPRWMIDAEEAETQREAGGRRRSPSSPARKAESNGFKDSDEEQEGPEEVLPQRPGRGAGAGPGTPRTRSPPRATQGPTRQAQRDAKPAQRQDDLLRGDNPQEGARKTGYLSPGRHPRPQASDGRSTGRPAKTHTAPAPRQPLKVRSVGSVSPDQVQRSAALKAEGNEHFKLGRFAEASTSYGSAIAALPAQHILTVPLYNNRATSLLKSGDHSGAGSDCTIVIKIIGPSYHPSKEEALGGDAKDIKLPDALFKALSKRAGAYEMGEKWDRAKEDWESLMTLPAADVIYAGPSGSSSRKTVSDGLARSKKMCGVVRKGGEDGQDPKPAPASKLKAMPVAKPAVAVDNTADSEGVAKMRQAAQIAEREDDLRASLKDTVDAKLAGWCKGKETNIRALLSSLDLILWDGLGFKKVGMAELITEKQVKIAYMRVIGKLHPDKLSVLSTTVEQRMLANGAFGTLNEAWKAFLGSS